MENRIFQKNEIKILTKKQIEFFEITNKIFRQKIKSKIEKFQK